MYVDESLFNETTGWRHRSWAPIGHEGRYHASRRRGYSRSVLPAYTLDGYLPCTAIKDGWCNGDELHDWIAFFVFVLSLVHDLRRDLLGKFAISYDAAVPEC